MPSLFLLLVTSPINAADGNPPKNHSRSKTPIREELKTRPQNSIEYATRKAIFGHTCREATALARVDAIAIYAVARPSVPRAYNKYQSNADRDVTNQFD